MDHFHTYGRKQKNRKTWAMVQFNHPVLTGIIYYFKEAQCE